MKIINCTPLILALGAASLIAQEPAYTNSIGMEFVLIKPGALLTGRFQSACPGAAGQRGPGRAAPDPRTLWTSADDKLCEELVKRDAMPGFTVRIERPFYLGKYEVTQAEWKKVMGTNPSVFQGSKVKDDAGRRPVDSVTWEDTQAFLKKLNAMEKTKLYRLPTEFEWEYAGKAGSVDDPTWDEIRQLAWEQDINKGTTHIVGTKKPNPWGLYDMLGNVWEWVQDYYNEKIFPDPTPPRTGKVHVLKGAGFLGDVKNTIYSTHAAGPGSKFDVGFRIAREAK
jgi:sulfatase modifying factor 1